MLAGVHHPSLAVKLRPFSKSMKIIRVGVTLSGGYSELEVTENIDIDADVSSMPRSNFATPPSGPKQLRGYKLSTLSSMQKYLTKRLCLNINQIDNDESL